MNFYLKLLSISLIFNLSICMSGFDLAKAVKKSEEPSAAAKKKSDMADWIKKTRNSPAQKSGAWKGQEHKLYEQHLRHKAWKESRKKKNKK